MHAPQYAVVSVLHGQRLGNGLDYLGNRKQWSRGHVVPQLFLQEQDTAYVLTEPLSKKSIKKCFSCVCVYVCVQLCERVCVGLCQEMAELSGRRCLLHSLAVGVRIMRVTEACLCVGANVSLHSAYAYVQYVCLRNTQ